jgi:PAS domain S-box-containing protein
MTIINQSNIPENTYYMTFMGTPVPLLLLDSTGQIVNSNTAFETLSGFSAKQLEGRELSSILLANCIEADKEQESKRSRAEKINCGSRLLFEQLLEQKETHCFLKLSENASVPICASINPINPTSDNLYVLSASKIIQAAQLSFEQGVSAAGEAIKESEDKFRLLVSGVKDYAIFMLDERGIIASWNEGAQRIKGYKADEIIGSHFSRFYTEKDLLENKPQHELAIALEEGRFEEEGWRVRKDGSLFMAHVLITPIKTETGKLKGYAKITRDITEQRKLVADIKELNDLKATLNNNLDELKRSNEDLQQFAYVCSHDLQEPLRVISNYSQLLAKRYTNKVLDHTAVEFIEITIDAAKRMQGLINDLLAYSRVQSRPREFETVDCNEVLKKVLANLMIPIEEVGAIVQVDQLPSVRADASQLQQLFQNIIGNAIKFRQTQTPEVSITFQMDSTRYIFAIKDNGLGFDAKYADRIFIMFQRLHAREAYPGSGMGLAICKKIVERHKGQLWVESKTGEGSTFYFALPK